MLFLLDSFSLFTVRTLCLLLCYLPYQLALKIVEAGFLVGFRLITTWRKISIRNMRQVFPDKPQEFYESLLRKNITEMARLVVDSGRLSRLDERWVRGNVECPQLERFRELSSEANSGVLIATGHLGSFELMGHAIGLLGTPIAVVVRSFRLPRLNRWWKTTREARGNKVIDRAGAFKNILKEIESGRSVAVLFDQNVRRGHAVFVPFFGRIAATTKSIALAALRSEAPVMVASIRYDHARKKYVIDAEEVKIRALLESHNHLENEEKIALITQRLNAHFSTMITNFPEGWFWMHRRWKTTPEGAPENFYAGC